MSPQTLKNARSTRAYLEKKAVEARQARDWDLLERTEASLGKVNEAIRQHFQEEAAAAEAARLEADERLF